MTKRAKPKKVRGPDRAWDMVPLAFETERFVKDAIQRRAKKAGHSIGEMASLMLCEAVSRPQAPPKLKNSVIITCACCEKFRVHRPLAEEAWSGKREIYCPRGHEISWRGGKLGQRLVTHKMLLKELEKSTHFKFLGDLYHSIEMIEEDSVDE